MRSLLLVSLSALVLCGCGSIAKEYVSADRDTYEAVAPEYRAYIDTDSELTDAEKALRHATLDSWEYRIKQAEEAGDE